MEQWVQINAGEKLKKKKNSRSVIDWCRCGN